MGATAEAKKYFKAALGYESFAYLGALLFVATLSLAITASVTAEEVYVYNSTEIAVTKNERVLWYALVAGSTFLTALSAYKDYEGWNFMTPCTISFGIFALIVSQSLWSQDKEDPIALSLFVVQILSISIQLGAIFNTAGRGSLPSQESSGSYTEMSFM